MTRGHVDSARGTGVRRLNPWRPWNGRHLRSRRGRFGPGAGRGTKLARVGVQRASSSLLDHPGPPEASGRGLPGRLYGTGRGSRYKDGAAKGSEARVGVQSRRRNRDRAGRGTRKRGSPYKASELFSAPLGGLLSAAPLTVAECFEEDSPCDESSPREGAALTRPLKRRNPAGGNRRGLNNRIRNVSLLHTVARARTERRSLEWYGHE